MAQTSRTHKEALLRSEPCAQTFVQTVRESQCNRRCLDCGSGIGGTYWYCTDSKLYSAASNRAFQMRRLDHIENTKSEYRLHVTFEEKGSHSSNVLRCHFSRARFSLGCLASCTLLPEFAYCC